MKPPGRPGADEIDEELQDHLRMAVAERVARGEDPHAAELAARREFGNVTHIAEVTREMQSGPWLYLAQASQDFRLAIRRMRRSPALAAAIALTIGLGLGGASAIFTVSGAALVEPLPYAEPERLVHLWEMRVGTEERSPTSYPTFLDWRSRARSFRAIEGYDPSNVTVGVGDEARMLRGAQLTAGFFRLLGVRPASGRDFLPEEDATSGAGVAIVSDRLAHSIAGEIALGRSIAINGTPHVIVGVLPAAFHFALLQNAEVFVPLVANAQRRADRSERSIHVIGRLRGNVPLASARADLSDMMTRLAGEQPDAMAGRSVTAMPLRDALLRNMKPVLATLLIAAALLLAIMGANLALLMLTRYVERSPELAMRSALGATRGRVLRQLLVESLVPSLVGAVIAIAIGQLTTRGLIAVIPEGVRISMPYLTDVGLDGRTVVVIVGLTTVLAIAFGLAPGLLITRAEVGRPVAGDARTTLGRADRRLRRGLVAAQMALTVVLLVASGLLLMSFSNVVRRDLGLRDPGGVVTARVPLSGPRYQEARAQQQFYETLLARAAVLPGVRAAAVIDEVPGGGGGITTFEPVDLPRPRPLQPRAALRTIGGAYFSTMGIPVTAGRAFDSRDRADSPPVAVVSASFARLLREDGAVLGRKLRLARTGQTEWEVAGVVGDVQVAALDAESPPVIYLSHHHAAENRMTLVVRTEIGAAAVASQVRSIVKTFDAGVPVYSVATIEQQMSDSRAVFSRRFPMILCGVFAVAALALTLVALYAICTHEVLTRRRELGIRLALGGSPAALRRLILSDAMRLGVIGTVAGSLVAVLVSRSMEAVLFGITATDWRVYGAVAVGVLASTLVVTGGPAIRAGAMSPSLVMRQE